jgi:Zn finger protein HypA/HybF involved in hydrogenase expression
MATEAYCVKCKAKSKMKTEEEVTMKTGRKAMQGPCEKCGTKMFRILGGAAKK